MNKPLPPQASCLPVVARRWAAAPVSVVTQLVCFRTAGRPWSLQLRRVTWRWSRSCWRTAPTSSTETWWEQRLMGNVVWKHRFIEMCSQAKLRQLHCLLLFFSFCLQFIMLFCLLFVVLFHTSYVVLLRLVLFVVGAFFVVLSLMLSIFVCCLYVVVFRSLLFIFVVLCCKLCHCVVFVYLYHVVLCFCK